MTGNVQPSGTWLFLCTAVDEFLCKWIIIINVGSSMWVQMCYKWRLVILVGSKCRVGWLGPFGEELYICFTAALLSVEIKKQRDAHPPNHRWQILFSTHICKELFFSIMNQYRCVRNLNLSQSLHCLNLYIPSSQKRLQSNKIKL